MDGIIALGHFCETHGPCVILSTQKYAEEPQQKPHSLIVPWCEACKSLELEQAFVSRDENYCYVTTRTPLLQEEAFLLRQATVRSLSCEQEGTLYFGDSERAHVYSHTFNVHDSLARGFQRKYTLMVLMKDKLKLLHSWGVFSKHILKIAEDLVNDSKIVNAGEQRERSQKALRQSEGSLSNVSRSLEHLTGKPGIFAHLHLWFTWLHGCPVIKADLNVKLPRNTFPEASSYLRILRQEMGDDIFSRTLLLFLNGASMQCDDARITTAFKSLWPKDSPCLEPIPGNVFYLYKNDNGWTIDTKLDVKLPKSKLQRDLEHVLREDRISEKTAHHQIAALVTVWIHVVNILVACPEINIHMLNSLNVSRSDIPMLSFIISKYSPKLSDKLISNLNIVYQK